MNEDLRKLRKKMDANDPFLAGGHQIVKARTREKEIPAWANNNVETQKLLLKAFPKLRLSNSQRRSAARWGAIISMFYRMNWTYSQVAEELSTSPKAVERILYRIRRVAKGSTKHSRGRPKAK